jgi:hypothetical protein
MQHIPDARSVLHGNQKAKSYIIKLFPTSDSVFN